VGQEIINMLSLKKVTPLNRHVTAKPSNTAVKDTTGKKVAGLPP
jgi:hypothetical protein